MSAKLLHAFADDNSDLQKQIGCMTGIFQMFDRHHLLAGRRLTRHSRKRLPPGNALLHDSHLQAETNPLPPQIVLDKNLSKSLNENHRVSLESSGVSFSSSSCSSSLSSLECNKSIKQEPSLLEHTTFPERSLKDSPMSQTSEVDSRLPSSSPCRYPQNRSAAPCQQSLDFRDVVKDSIYRDTHSLSIKTSNKDEVKKHVIKHKDSPRPLPLSETIDKPYLIGRNEKPNMSLDLSRSIDVLANLKEVPRYFSENKPPRSSYEAKDSSFFPVAHEARRFSYDGRETSRSSMDAQANNKCSTRLKELPRLSLDGRQSSIRSSNPDSKSNSFMNDLEVTDANKKTYQSLTLQKDLDTHRQPTSVVAKLMGLEAMPSSSGEQDHTHLSKRCTTNDNNTFYILETNNSFSKSRKIAGGNKLERLSSSSLSSLKESVSPPLRHVEPVIKPISNSRIPIETAPWKQQGKSHGTRQIAFRPREDHIRQQHGTVYSEIERKLKELEIQQSNKDVRALKQMLDAIQSKGLLETKKDESPSSMVPDEKNSQQPIAGTDQNLRTANRQKPLRHLNTTLLKGANIPRPLEAPIVIMKPAKSINRYYVPASSIIPFDGLSSLHNVRTGDLIDTKKIPVNNSLAKERIVKLSLGDPVVQVLSAGKNSDRHREEKSLPRVHVQTAQSSPRPQQPPKENSGSTVKTSGSVSPKLLQRKPELEKKSHSSVSSFESTKSRKQSTTRHISGSVSPRSKIRPKAEQVQERIDKMGEVPSNRRNLRHQNDEISLRTHSNISLASQMDRQATGAEQSSELTSILVQQGDQSPTDGSVDNIISVVMEKKSLQDFSEDASAELSAITLEQPSPVSVLDASFYREDLPPSPINRISNSSGGDGIRNSEVSSGVIWKTAGPDSHVPNNPKFNLSSTMYHRKLESIENLLQKLRQLRLSNDAKSTASDIMGSLCEVQNPDCQYASEVLLASGLLNNCSHCPMSTHLHKSGYVMDPGLFFVLEQARLGVAKPEWPNENTVLLKCDQEKLHRRLLFDTVNEILTQKLELAGPNPQPGAWSRLADRNRTGQQLLKELCWEIERLQDYSQGGGVSCDDEYDSLNPILCEDVVCQSQGWKDLGKEYSGLVLDVERSIFKDLINEVVNGEWAASGQPAKTSRRCRQLFCK